MSQSDQPTAVTYAAAGATADAFQKSRSSPLRVAEILPRLRAAIEKAGLWVLHEINPQMLLQRGGYAIAPARQILFFHPRYVVRLVQADRAALLEAPLKLAVFEQPDGPTCLRWPDPAAALARYGHPDLAALGAELAAICDAIVADALAEEPDHGKP